MKTLRLLALLFLPTLIVAQERIEPIKFGDMEQWLVRYIKESKLLGGKTKILYALAPTDTIRKTAVYDFNNTCWGISNAYASPASIDKAANTTQPEKRGNGTCARLDTRIEAVQVLGCIDIEVCIAGTLFLGKVLEPAKNVNDPYSIINMGIPFDQKPKAVMLDLKAKVNPERKVLRATGFSKKKWFEGHDEPEVYVYLQKRW
ncbi:MAG: PCMD domain-containing protein, partial [Paludibacteraceae bacterium]|nr:PCMD domain-containing protein [Paludibacteraceae bacterium]